MYQFFASSRLKYLVLSHYDFVSTSVFINRRAPFSAYSIGFPSVDCRECNEANSFSFLLFQRLSAFYLFSSASVTPHVQKQVNVIYTIHVIIFSIKGGLNCAPEEDKREEAKKCSQNIIDILPASQMRQIFLIYLHT